MAIFKESEHPRDKDGKFVEKGKGNRNVRLSESMGVYSMKTKNSNVTKKEWALWYKAIGEIKRGVRYTPAKDNNKYIEINNKIFITSGTYAKPKLIRVIEFNDMETLDEFMKDIAEDEIW